MFNRRSTYHEMYVLRPIQIQVYQDIKRKILVPAFDLLSGEPANFSLLYATNTGITWEVWVIAYIRPKKILAIDREIGQHEVVNREFFRQTNMFWTFNIYVIN